MKQVILTVWMMTLIQVCMCYLGAFKADDCAGVADRKFLSIDCVPTDGEYKSFMIVKETRPEVWELFKDDTCSETTNATVLDVRKQCLSTSTITAVKKWQPN